MTVINAEVRSQIMVDINKGWFKAQQDFLTLGEAFTIEDNAWLFNKSSEEYNALRRQVGFANFYLNNIKGRIDKINEASDKLKIKIQDALH